MLDIIDWSIVIPWIIVFLSIPLINLISLDLISKQLKKRYGVIPWKIQKEIPSILGLIIFFEIVFYPFAIIGLGMALYIVIKSVMCIYISFIIYILIVILIMIIASNELNIMTKNAKKKILESPPY